MKLEPGAWGVTIFRGRRPMRRPCADCPFKLDALGQNYLHPERMGALKFCATVGKDFHCHKTVYHPRVPAEVDEETGEERRPSWHRSYRQCAGANEYARGVARTLGIAPTIIGEPFPEDGA